MYLLIMRQQDNKYTEVIYDRLDSALLNLKLVGGNIHPKELQARETFLNTSCSEKYTDITV